MSMQWLLARAPGFKLLPEEDRHAIVDFSLLWSLFEARILNSSGSANGIIASVDAWRGAGTLQAAAYDHELAYFRQRYFADPDVTYHFDHLHLKQNDHSPLVRSVVNGSNNDPCDRVAAVFIIVLRYRNNLFHGVKWQYQLVGQRDNFTNANAVMMKALDQHGELDRR